MRLMCWCVRCVTSCKYRARGRRYTSDPGSGLESGAVGTGRRSTITAHHVLYFVAADQITQPVHKAHTAYLIAVDLRPQQNGMHGAARHVIAKARNCLTDL